MSCQQTVPRVDSSSVVQHSTLDNRTLHLAFFSIQPCITHLTIYEPSSLASAYSRPYIRSLPPDILPNLSFICANPITIHACAPGRPITHVYSDHTALFSATTYLFCEGLK